jgi:nucleotide-binding universal stress UspA family protein
MSTDVMPGKKIVVGLSLGEGDAHLVESVVGLASMLHYDIIFAYAILPFQSYAYGGEGALYPLSSYEQSFRDFSESQGKEKLDELMQLAESIGKAKINISYQMSYSEPSQGLLSIAEKEKASLIICGYHPENEPSSDFFGMSISQSLFSDSSRPVLAIPVDKVYTFKRMISFADDLSETSERLFQRVYDLAKTMHTPTLHHLHINHISREKIAHMVDVVQNAIISGSITSEDNFDRETYLENTERAALELMQRRFDSAQSRSSSQIKHLAEVSFDHTQRAIEASIDRHKPDLVVFGSHHILNRKTLTLGKIPYQAMLSLKLPVLVITDQSLETP